MDQSDHQKFLTYAKRNQLRYGKRVKMLYLV